MPNEIMEGRFLTNARISKFPEMEIPRNPFITNFNHKFFVFGSCFAIHTKRLLDTFGFETFYHPWVCCHFSASGMADVMSLASGETGLNDEHFYPVSDSEVQVLVSALPYRIYGDNALSKAKLEFTKLLGQLRQAVSEIDTVIVTLGTSRVVRLKSDKRLVSVVNGIPRDLWEMDMLSVEDNVSCLERLVQSIKKIRGGRPFRFIVTVSPQRYLFGKVLYNAKEAHGGLALVDNSLSKAILRVAAETTVSRSIEGVTLDYFPSYEIVIDQFRLTEPLIHFDCSHIDGEYTPARVIKMFLQSYAADHVLQQLIIYTKVREDFKGLELAFQGGLTADHPQTIAKLDEITRLLDQFGPDLCAPLIHLRIVLHRRFGRTLPRAIDRYTCHRSGNLIQLAEMTWLDGNQNKAIEILARVITRLEAVLSVINIESSDSVEQQMLIQAKAKREIFENMRRTTPT